MQNAGETLNKMAWPPNILQSVERATAGGKGELSGSWKGNGVQHHIPWGSQQMTEQALWGQAAFLCGRVTLESEASKEKGC